MREIGERFVCDRCKKEVFIAKEEPTKYASGLPDGWGWHYEGNGNNSHLCDDCYSTYQVMIADFISLRDIKVVG